MRKKYFDSYLDILTEEQRSEILTNIKNNIEQVNDNLHIDENNVYQYLINILNSKVTHDNPYHEETLDSYKFNKFLMDVYFNVNMMYSELESLYKSIDINNKLNIDVLDSINAYINELEKRLEKFRYFAANNTHDFIFKESFDKTSYIETLTEDNKYMFADRNGDILPQATIVKDGGFATLNEIVNTNIISEVTPKIEIKRGNLSSYVVISPMNNMIDMNKTKFFAEVAYTDYSIDNIKVTLTFNLTKKYRINSICISPMSVFSQEIDKIYYKTTSSDEEQFKELKFTTTVSNGDTYIVMQPTNISIIQIVLKQKNYIERIIKYFADQDWEDIAETIAKADINAKISGNNIGDSFVESITGYESYMQKYNAFINTYNNFVRQLNAAGYYWSEQQVIDYIKSKS